MLFLGTPGRLPSRWLISLMLAQLDYVDYRARKQSCFVRLACICRRVFPWETEAKQKAAELRAAGGDMTEDAHTFFAHVYHFPLPAYAEDL